jgi:hypothetical protein
MIEYVDFTVGFECGNNKLEATDVKAWKYSHQVGVVSLLVYTVNYEY